MSLLSYIIWSPTPNIIPGLEIPRWYGLLFAMGFIVSQQIMYYIYRKEGKSERQIDVLTIHMILGVVLGARLGHCLFYDPVRYLSNPLLILKIWEGGLASHGGALGILVAVYIFVNYEIKVSYLPIIKGFISLPKSIKSKRKKREGQSFLWVVDRLVIVVAITGAMIRTGNFVNSEIIGKPTGTDFGVVFSRSFEEVLLADPAIDHVAFEKASDRQILENGAVPIDAVIYYKRDNKLTAQSVARSLNSKLSSLRKSTRISEHILIPPGSAQNVVNVQVNDLRHVATAGLYGISRHPAQLYEAI
ncbi:MAG: prolipoprotein diacylglyceryl transferase, partial [Cyclobacteriaceae bacterium]